MEEQNIQRVRRYLTDTHAQQRVREDIERAREDATVTIGRAAELFGFSESQLRDWESRGLLNPKRSKDKGGQRLYALEELDKLALLKELTEIGDYSIGSIPSNISDIWHSLLSQQEQRTDFHAGRDKKADGTYPSIDKRVDEAGKADFWQYYISQTLRIALSLVFEDIPETIAGIILPLERKENAVPEWDSKDVDQLGPCLIGWRDQDRMFHTFYQEVPSFDYPTDFRVRGLRARENEESGPKDTTFIVIQRKARDLSLPLDVVEAVRRLLQPIYEDIHTWLQFFKESPRDIVYSTSALRSINSSDSLLTFLANQVIRLGGKNTEGKDRWRFCSILLPRDSSLLLQMQTLVVQAQSQRSPHTIGKTSVSPDASILSLSLRAFQSIHMLFRSPISTQDTAIVFRDLESPINSAIAMPIGGENGTPLGVLYVVSEEVEAFGKEYQRVLRLMGRVIRELLLLVQLRRQSEERLLDIITEPRVINRTLAGFASENKLINDIETLLRSIKNTNTSEIEGQTAFIALDIDDLTDVINRYDDYVSINLSRVLGNRIRAQIGPFYSENDYQIYHAYSDRFYLRLDNVPLRQARVVAEELRQALQGNYLVPLTPAFIDKPKAKVETIEGIKVRLGVLWYEHKKLSNLLERYPRETQLADVKSTIFDFLDTSLSKGKQMGGNCIISYYPRGERKSLEARLAIWEPTEEVL